MIGIIGPHKGPFFISMRASRGFTIIELLVVIVIVSILIAMAAVVTRAITSQQRRTVTATRITAIDGALVQFVMQQRRLPCPANGALPVTDVSYGRESAPDDTTGCPAEQNGVVPWLTLGVTDAEASDGWERRFTYRVQPVLAAKRAMDMSWCDPAGTGATISPAGEAPNACNTACVATDLTKCTPPLTFLAGKGLTIQNVAGATVMLPPNTGAAYVVVSHGETGGGGMLNSGIVYASTTTDSAQEQVNYVDKAYVGGIYVDDSLADAPGATHFDDIVSRPTILSVVSKSGLAPRAHLP